MGQGASGRGGEDERPAWCPDSPGATVRGRGGRVGLKARPASLEDELGSAAGRGLTLTHLSAAAALLLVHLQTGNAQPHIGLIHAGRDDESTQSQIGLFVNTLVLGLPLNHGAAPRGGTARGWLDRVRQVTIEALDHAALHYADLVSALAPQRHAGRQPWFDLALNVLEGDLAEAGLQQLGNGAAVERLEQAVVDAKFDLTLTLERSAAGAVQLSLEYAHSFCQAAQAQVLVEQFAQLLAALAHTAASETAFEAPPIEHRLEPLLAAAAPAPSAVLHEPLLSPQDLWERFDAVAQRQPESPALQPVNGPLLSYGELRGQALAVAHALDERGVRAGDHAGLAVALIHIRSPAHTTQCKYRRRAQF